MRTNLEKIIFFSPSEFSVTVDRTLGAMCYKEGAKCYMDCFETISHVTDCPVYHLALVSPELLQCNNMPN